MSALLLATIPGEPVPAARPRVVGSHAFTPDRYRRWKAGAALVLRAAGAARPCPPLVPLEVVIAVYHPRPLARPRHVEPALWRMGTATPAITRSDLDNHAKAVLDSLQDSGWLDNDNRVAYLVASSRYTAVGDAPRVVVSVASL